MNPRSQIIAELSRMSRDGWKDARPADYLPLEAELRALDLPVAVVDEETQPVTVLKRFASISEAEEWIGQAEDQAKVVRGGFGIDAPEEMVNP